MEGHWKFLRGGGVLEAKFLETMYENKLKFPGGRGGGCKTKNLLWEEYGYFTGTAQWVCEAQTFSVGAGQRSWSLVLSKKIAAFKKRMLVQKNWA